MAQKIRGPKTPVTNMTAAIANKPRVGQGVILEEPDKKTILKAFSILRAVALESFSLKGLVDAGFEIEKRIKTAKAAGDIRDENKTREDIIDALLGKGYSASVKDMKAEMEGTERLVIAIFGSCDLETVRRLRRESGIPAYLICHRLSTALATLTPREEAAVCMRFGLQNQRIHTLREVGELFGVSAPRARQIECKALRKLRHPIRSRRLKTLEGKHADSPCHGLEFDYAGFPVDRLALGIDTIKKLELAGFTSVGGVLDAGPKALMEKGLTQKETLRVEGQRVILLPGDVYPAGAVENLRRSVSTLELSVWALDCMDKKNIKLVGELVQFTENDLLRMGFGIRTLRELKYMLSDMGLSLGMNLQPKERETFGRSKLPQPQ
jgi:hypothetical protein